jgi:hypothetical protein
LVLVELVKLEQVYQPLVLTQCFQQSLQQAAVVAQVMCRELPFMLLLLVVLAAAVLI